MKKLNTIAGVALAAALTLSSCGAGEKSKDADTVPSAAFCDSISTYYGLMAGGIFASELHQYQQDTHEQYNRQEFYKGLMMVLGSDHPDEYMAGVSSGLRMMADIRNMEKMGVKINHEKLMAAVRQMLMKDSVSLQENQINEEEYSRMINQVSQAAQERDRLRRLQAPEAVAAVKTGQAALARLQRENPDFKTTQSGMGYVIENPGTGEKVQRGSHVVARIEGKHLDGTVFQSGDNSLNLIPASTVPGVCEAFQMLAVGGKGTFYVPGSLAYGVDGNPQAGIKPMEMLIFEIEVESVHNDISAPGKDVTSDQPQEATR